MIEFELYDDVISDFSKNEDFTRYTTTVNDIGREEKIALPIQTIFCYIHPASDKDLQVVSREGYHPEFMVKIFAKVDADIIQDDQVIYNGDTYRVMKTNVKLVGDFRKHFAELLKA